VDWDKKATHRFEKASIPLKNYFKKLAILEKASKVFKNNSNLYRNPSFGNRSLHFFENVF
jgi:hypothetical protein